MVYQNDFRGEKLSGLGFGTMRLPLIPGGTQGSIDQAELDAMVDFAIANGVNYFDTAYPYHEGLSELAIGKSLSRYPRETWNLATKFPGHQIMKAYNPAEVFEEQLEKCGVEYFDYYLLHNVNEKSIRTYMDPKWGIMDYFISQKHAGKIRHLGFSSHGELATLHEFIGAYGDELEFCQIQLNYLDWTLQKAKEKYDYLTEAGLGVWVMEPVHGGKLTKLDVVSEEELRALRSEESIPAFAFRFLQRLPNVKMILSGMSNLDQMKDNVKTFSERKALTDEETDVILGVAERLKNAVPCTGCRYCCDGCPMGIDIPKLIAFYNEAKLAPSFNLEIAVSSVPEEHMPSACIGCGQCAAICPQNLDIPSLMPEMDAEFRKLPSWVEVCKQREAAAEALKKSKGK